MTMPLSLRIDFPAGGKPVVTVTAAAPFGDNQARVQFGLNFDPANPTPQPKRREGESDEAYAERVGKILPHTLDVAPELLEGLPERCGEILEAVREVCEHYAAQAAAAHTLAAKGKAPPGVKQIKVGGTLAPKGTTDTTKG